MGLFSSHEKKASEFYNKSQKTGLSPEQRRQLLMKALIESDKAGKGTDVAMFVRLLLVQPCVARNIDALRAQLSTLKTIQGSTIFSNIEELEQFGLNNVGIGKDEIRAFLMQAAEQGCCTAAEYGKSQFGWEGLEASYRLAALRGHFAFAGLSSAGLRFSLAQTLSQELSPALHPNDKNRIGGVVGGLEHTFWKEFDELLNRSEQKPPYEVYLARLQACRKADGTDPEVKKAEQDRVKNLRTRLEHLRHEAWLHDDWLAPELLETFCDWLVENERYELTYVKGRPVPADWRPATPSAEAEALFREGRIEEHLGHDYQKIIKLYQRAADMGHGEAAYRMSLLTEIWETSGTGSYRDWDKKARQAGWLMTDGADADVQFFAAVQMARRGDSDGLHTLRNLLYRRWEYQPKEKGASRPSEDQPWFKEAKIASQLELAVNRRLADQGDPEAMYHLSVLYTDIYNSDLHLRDEELQARYRDECFSTGLGLAYYEAAVKPYTHFVYGRGCAISSETELSAVRRDLARLAEKTGFVGAVQETERLIAKAEEREEIQRQRSEAFKREYYAQQRRAAEARYAEARRQAVEAGMDKYRDRRDWAERAASAALGGSGTTLDESYLRGEVGMDSYGTALFIRGEQEDALRRRLEEEYDAAHHPDEE